MLSVLSNSTFSTNTGIPVTGTIKLYKTSSGTAATTTYSDEAMTTQTNEFPLSAGKATIYTSGGESVFAKVFDGDRLLRVFPKLNTASYEVVMKDISDVITSEDLEPNKILVITK